jgi:hypothetical protein
MVPPSFFQFLIYVVLEVVTMAMVGTTVILPTAAPLSDMILPTVSLPLYLMQSMIYQRCI